jgi:hypothetical protein
MHFSGCEFRLFAEKYLETTTQERRKRDLAGTEAQHGAMASDDRRRTDRSSSERR